jgi:hypothetical protein
MKLTLTIVSAALLATGANAAAVDILGKRDTTAAKVTWYKNVNCDSLAAQGSASLSAVIAAGGQGDCVTVPTADQPRRSVKVTDLYKTCTGALIILHGWLRLQ